MEKVQTETNTKTRFLIFRLGQETFGTPLLKVREVVENRSAQAVPNSAAGFEGVINLRGEVIGVIDLRTVLKIPPSESLSILIFDAKDCVMGAIVDRCLSVSEISENEINSGFAGTSHGVDAKYVIGIGKLQEKLVTLIDLTEIPAILTESNG